MSESAETLEVQLAEKEQLVAALTERLEQAAEQLDRLHRTGADRGLRSGVMGVPAELIEQQQKLVDDLQRAVQQWEDMQPGAFFGRLEAQLAQIQDAVRNYEPSGHAGSSPAGDYGRYSSESSDHGESRRGDGESPQSVLAFMKASLQSEGAEDESSQTAEGSSSSADASHTVCYLPLPPLDDPPEPIDVSQAAPEELGPACEARDTYIVYLLQRLRQIESLGHVPNSWAGLENIPGELRQRLETLEKRLEETLRLAEVELSLQRARLAREEVRIRMMGEQAQKELKRAKDASDNSADDEADAKSGQRNTGRWRRMLGRREDG